MLKELLVRVGMDPTAFERGANRTAKAVGAMKTKIKGELKEVDAAFGRFKNSVTNAQNLIAGAFAGGAIAGLLKMADGYNQLQARIRGITKETGDYMAVSRQLSAIAKKTGNDLRATVDTFQRLSFSRNELGATNGQLLELTEIVQQLGVISGSSGEAMKAGLLQFDQAMSAGVVRAEEFNSLLENMPALANKIADSLGVSVGQLRKMVLEGKLTSKEVFEGLLSKSAEVRKEFEAMPMTLERATNSMLQDLQETVGQIDQNIGVTRDLANEISSLSNFVKENGEAFTVLANIVTGVIKVVYNTVKLLVQGLAGFLSSTVAVIGGVNVAILEGINHVAREATKKINEMLTKFNSLPDWLRFGVKIDLFKAPQLNTTGAKGFLRGATKELDKLSVEMSKTADGIREGFLQTFSALPSRKSGAVVRERDVNAVKGKGSKASADDGKKKKKAADKAAKELKEREERFLKESLQSLKNDIEDSRTCSEKTIREFGIAGDTYAGEKEDFAIKTIQEQSRQIQREMDLQKQKLLELNAMSFKTVEVDRERKEAIKEVQQEIAKLTNAELENKNNLAEAIQAREAAIKAFNAQKAALTEEAIKQQEDAELAALKDMNARELMFLDDKLERKKIKEKDYHKAKIALLQTEFDKETQIINARIERLRAEQAALGNTVDEQLKRMEIENQINQLIAEREGLDRAFNTEVARENLDALKDKMSEVKNFLEDIGRKTEDVFINIFKKGQFSVKEFFAALLEDLARLVIRLTIIIPMIQFMVDLLSGIGSKMSGGGSGKGGFWGALLNIGGSILTGVATSAIGGAGGIKTDWIDAGQAAGTLPKFAAGGNPSVGQTVLVGEEGPELFKARTQGTIIPNHELGGMSGESVIVNHEWKIVANDTKGFREMLAREKPFIQRMSTEAVQIAQNKRGRPGPLDKGRGR